MWGGAGRCIKDQKVRRQKGEEEDEEYVGGNGEKEEEDKDRQRWKTTFNAWQSVNNADKCVMMKTGAVWIVAVLNSVTLHKLDKPFNK